MKLKKIKKQPKGNSYDGSKEYVEKKNHTLIIVGISLILAIIIGLIIFIVSRSKTCNGIEKMITDRAYSYAEHNDILPIVEGESITLNIDELFEEETLRPTLDEYNCSGTIKVTKHKDNYIYTYDVTNCGYCTTEIRYKKWSKEISKQPSKKYLIEAIPYYNYYATDFYHSSWSKWISEDEIGETDPTYKVALPLKSNVLPKISSEANIIEYEKDDATWYSYRDKKWKYYKDNGGTYSVLSSEQPAGFEKKDNNTLMKTEWTEWSLDYPETKSYREIGSTLGYRWYYQDGDKKVYWNSGAYYPTKPDKKYNKKEKETVRMYRYQDKMWKWYNGKKRSYSGYISLPNKIFPTRDIDLVEYSKWSNYSPESKLDPSICLSDNCMSLEDQKKMPANNNSWYREEQTKTYSRYRISYSMKSFLKLDNYVDKNEIERTLQGTVPELVKRTDIIMDIQYKYKYRKKHLLPGI